MARVKMIATDSVYHGGIITTGQEFEVSESDVGHFEKMGHVLAENYKGKKKAPHENKAIAPAITKVGITDKKQPADAPKKTWGKGFTAPTKGGKHKADDEDDLA